MPITADQQASSQHTSGSLTARLIIAAGLVSVLFFAVAGYALDRAYLNSQLAAQSERLYIRVFGLLAVAELDDVVVTLPRSLTDDRFNSPESGLIALVLDAERNSVWESLSSEWFTEGERIRGLENLNAGEEEFGQFGDWVYQRNGFLWEDATSQERYFEFWVLEDAAPLNQAVQTFRNQLWLSFGAVTLALLVALSIVTAWGLKPLRRLVANLQRIRDGRSDAIVGVYPTELAPLGESINKLIHAEQNQRERYRKAMGDLAHSLKTPLAVLRAVANDHAEVNEQVDRMDQIVRYQLQRAVTDARTGPVLGQRADLTDVLVRLEKALSKAFLHQDKVLDLPETEHPLLVALDVNDLLEVFGNLLENAFKYGRSVISVALEADDKGNQVIVHVDDDGPGIPVEQRPKVLARGQRLDTFQPGQGLGLAMVVDILDSYQVDVNIGKSPLGGARFTVKLPSAGVA